MRNAEQQMDKESCLLPEITAAVALAEPVLDVTLEPIGARHQAKTAVTFENGVAVFTACDPNNRIVYTIDTCHDTLTLEASSLTLVTVRLCMACLSRLLTVSRSCALR